MSQTMRVLVRSESEAFRLLIAAVVLAAVSVLVGYLLTPLAGIALFVLVAAVASLTDVRDLRNARSALREAALLRTLAWAAGHGIDADGAVGDAIAPFARIEDELRVHRFDQVIVLTPPGARADWFETELLERAREQLRSVPVTHVVIETGPGSQSHAGEPAR
jgi:hypothetical protein